MSVPPEVLDIVRQWAEKAEHDLRNAEHTLQLQDDCPFDTVCFHAQQCAEKYLKALLTLHGVHFPRAHDLTELHARLADRCQLNFPLDHLKNLNPYAVEMRYPGLAEPIDRAEAENAVAMARAVRAAVRSHLHPPSVLMVNTRLITARLYGFIDTAYLAGRDPRKLAGELIAGGVDMIQVRAKQQTHAARVELGLAVVGAAFPHNVPVIINDDIEAAFECGADGVHLGQEDWAAIPREQRVARLANMRLVGLSTHSLEQALQAERDGADYIGVGPVFATGTKPGVKPVGLELVRQVAPRVQIPFFAIGGITLSNVDHVRAGGATRVAVVSAILNAPDVKEAAAEFKRRLS